MQSVHDELRVSGAWLPAMHSLGSAAPPAQAKPRSQSKHAGIPLTSDLLAYWPGSHVGGSSKELPVGQNLPALHRVHDSARVTFWYEPAEHSVHTALPLCDAYEPVGQLSHEESPD